MKILIPVHTRPGASSMLVLDGHAVAPSYVLGSPGWQLDDAIGFRQAEAEPRAERRDALDAIIDEPEYVEWRTDEQHIDVPATDATEGHHQGEPRGYRRTETKPEELRPDAVSDGHVRREY